MKHFLLLLILGFGLATNSNAQCSSIIDTVLVDPNDFFTISFVDSSTGISANEPVIWSFGDGTYDTALVHSTTTHTYNSTGLYTIELNIADTSLNCSPSKTNIFVGSGSSSCQAAFQIKNNFYTPFTFTFTNFSNGNNLSYHWDMGDSIVSNLRDITHTYIAEGMYNICLTVTDNNGCTDTQCRSIIVRQPSTNCQAFWTYSYNGSNSYTFTDSSISNSGSYTRNWHIDGVASGGNPQITQTLTPGLHTICLHIQNNSSTSYCYSDYCIEVIVDSFPNGCNAAFNYTILPSNTEVQFNSTSTLPSSGVIFHNWHLGQGVLNTLTNPLNDYIIPGQYRVCLEITDFSGCFDTHCENITINNPPNTYDITGEVYNNSILADEAIVFLINTDSISLNQYRVKGTYQGSYEFRGIAPGNYLVKAALQPLDPNYADYLPTYYGDELFWSDADIVTVTNQDITGVDVDLIAGNNPGGPGFVSGLISQGANKRDIGDPEPDMQIMLLDMDNEPVQYTYSNAQGEWQFNNIAYGTYQVYAEVEGKVTEPVIITLSTDRDSINNIGITVETQRVTSIRQNSDVILISKADLFPNPTNGNITLAVTSKESTNVELVVTNALGQQIIRTQHMLNMGQQNLYINIDNKPKGMYFLQLRIDGVISVKRHFLKQ